MLKRDIPRLLALTCGAMLTDEQRGVFGAWLRRERVKAGYENVTDARKALQTRAGFGIAQSVWAEMESGKRKPSDEQRQVLTRFFDSQPEMPEQSSDLASLIAAQTAAITLQTAVLQELLAMLRPMELSEEERRLLAGSVASEPAYRHRPVAEAEEGQPVASGAPKVRGGR